MRSGNFVSPNNVRNYIHKISPTWLRKHDLNEDDTIFNVKGGRLTSPPFYTKNYRQINAGSSRDSFPQRRAHQLVVQYQMASPENIHTSSIHTGQVVFMNVFNKIFKKVAMI